MKKTATLIAMFALFTTATVPAFAHGHSHGRHRTTWLPK